MLGLNDYTWDHLGTLSSKAYICGHCGNDITSEKGWGGRNKYSGVYEVSIYVCHHCNRPTLFIQNGDQTPGGIMGTEVQNVGDKSVYDLYNEARKCTRENAFTAAVLCCRKLLMHIAVSKGDEPGKTFIEYVQFLSEKNYIPPDAKDWVDHIRKKGNEANHEISIMDKESAEDLIIFSGMLLKIIYEFPANIKSKISKPV